MKIYKLKIDVNKYKGCYVVESKLSKLDLEKIDIGEQLNFCNNSISFKYADEEGLILGDVIKCWDFGGFLINDRTRNILEMNPKLKIQYIKFQDDFNLINNLLVIDALDTEKTKFEYFENEIISIDKISLKKMDFPPLFQITFPDGLVELDYFVTNEFIEYIKQNNIKGFKFEEVWDSEKD